MKVVGSLTCARCHIEYREMVIDNTADHTGWICDNCKAEQQGLVAANAGQELLCAMMDRAGEFNEDGMPVVKMVDKENGGSVTYLRYDAVVKFCNTNFILNSNLIQGSKDMVDKVCKNCEFDRYGYLAPHCAECGEEHRYFLEKEGSLSEPRLSEELNKIIEAGNKLAEAAHKVQSDYDGIHRLRLALAEWYKIRANEFDRDSRFSV